MTKPEDMVDNRLEVLSTGKYVVFGEDGVLYASNVTLEGEEEEVVARAWPKPAAGPWKSIAEEGAPNRDGKYLAVAENARGFEMVRVLHWSAIERVWLWIEGRSALEVIPSTWTVLRYAEINSEHA